jgi:hypothetical protein
VSIVSASATFLIKKICAFSNVPRIVEDTAFLPSTFMFIDVDFTEEEYDIKDRRIFGIALRDATLLDEKSFEMMDKIDRGSDVLQQLDYKKGEWVNDTDLFKAGSCINALVFAKSHEGIIFMDSLTFSYKIADKYNDKKLITNRRIPTRSFIKKFVLNFLNFVNHKEVIEVKRIRGKKNAERRKKEGKMPLPDSRLIKVTGVLKRYINEQSSKVGWHYSFRFPVSEHKRRLYDEYGNIRKVVKVHKFYKGKGVTIERDSKYKVVADKKHSRVKEWNKEHIDMKDIKPLDKPLREKRNEKR